MRYSKISRLYLLALLISAGASRAGAHEHVAANPRPAQGLELLRRQIEEQQAQIRELQTTLQRESEQRVQQQRLLEELQQKLQRLDSSAAASGGIDHAPVVRAAMNAEKEASTPEILPNEKADGKLRDVQEELGEIKLNGLLQGWYLRGNEGFNDTFRVRRAELKLSGEMAPEARWTIMLDPAKALSVNNTFTAIGETPVLSESGVNQSSRILQDAYITLSYFQDVNVNVGQFKIPLGLEGQQSSAELDTERALFASDRARGGTFGDVRDIGVMLYGPLTTHIDYQVGVFNGSGDSQNDLDTNDQKAVVGRIIFRPPFVDDLQIGASGVWGNGEGADRLRRDRLGGELLYRRGPFTLQTEYMTGKDGRLEREGYYGHFAYHFTPKWEGVLRYDTWDPDTSLDTTAANVTERDYVAGLSHFIDGNRLKFQVNYLRKTFENDVVEPFNLAVLSLQSSW